MEITPGESWVWTYRNLRTQSYLGVLFAADNGHSYFLKTNFMVQKLHTFPETGQPFSVKEAMMFNACMEGLRAVGVHNEATGANVSSSMELALNAVACAQFVRVPKRVIEHGFLPYIGTMEHIDFGQVVSLCSKDHRVCDFIVLNDEDDATDGVFRLMFVNREFSIDTHLLTLGACIKVPRAVIGPFRGTAKNTHSMSYA